MSEFTQERGSHWYSQDGKPSHVQPDGKKTTLRHARKDNLLPSVTNILSIIPKHTVEDWRVEQAVIATMQCMSEQGAGALTAPEMMAKVAAQLEGNTSVGRTFGTEMHAIIEHINTHRALPPALSPLSLKHGEHAQNYLNWLIGSELEVVAVEKPFACTNWSVGYGGCIDLIAKKREGRRTKHYVIDFKTQNVKGSKPRIYPEWAYQLAAYRSAAQIGDSAGINTSCISVVIDSNTGTITQFDWADEDIEKGFDVFRKASELWAATRQYWPKTARPVGIDAYLENVGCVPQYTSVHVDEAILASRREPFERIEEPSPSRGRRVTATERVINAMEQANRGAVGYEQLRGQEPAAIWPSVHGMTGIDLSLNSTPTEVIHD